MSLIDRTTPFGERVAERLTNDLVIWLTTVRPDGQALPTPVWFWWDSDESLMTYSQPQALKLRNIETNARVTLNFNSDAHGDDVVRFEALASIDPSAPQAREIPAMVEKYRAESVRLGWEPEHAWDEYTVPIRVKLTRLWGFLD